jgi:chromosome segregation ATPase
MFWLKARKIKELKTLVNELTAAINTNKITVRVQDQTISDMKKELDSARAEIQTKMNDIEQFRKIYAAEIATLTEQVRDHAAEVVRTRAELEKAQDKILQLEEDLREKDRVAQAAARRDSFSSLSDLNDHDHKPEKKASEEPSPGIGDYQSGRTHEEEWR